MYNIDFSIKIKSKIKIKKLLIIKYKKINFPQFQLYVELHYPKYKFS